MGHITHLEPPRETFGTRPYTTVRPTQPGVNMSDFNVSLGSTQQPDIESYQSGTKYANSETKEQSSLLRH
jgi:hypothetical protein